MDANTKCVRLKVTRQAIVDFVAGWLPPCKPISSLDKKFKNHYVYYNSDRDVFEIICWTDDCPEGAVPEDIGSPVYKIVKEEKDIFPKKNRYFETEIANKRLS